MAEQTEKVKGDRVVIDDRVGVVISVERDGGVVLFDAVPGSGSSVVREVLRLSSSELMEAPHEPLPLSGLFAAFERPSVERLR